MRILCIEDNKGDRLLITEAFKEAKVSCDLRMVNDGLEALKFLKAEGEFCNEPKPSLILLDLNLPGKSGFEVLSHLKNDPGLQNIPVIILSNSSSKKDICASYSLNASAYVSKPSQYEGYLDLAHMIKGFWINLASYC
jgi:two-component system, chemotaxis family, response regulator Rcp1